MGELSFEVFGPVRALRDGVALDLQTPGQRALLAVLLLTPGSTATTHQLVEALWERPPRTSEGLIRTYVSRLRRTLGPDVIDRVSRVYQLRVDPATVDLGRFDAAVDEARRAREAHEPAAAVAALRTALTVSDQPPLSGLTGPFADGQRLVLVQRRLDVVEECLALEVGLGHEADVIGELTDAASAHPLRERLVRVCMVALHRLGRTAEALERYHATRLVLQDETGMDPGPGLQACYESLLQHREDRPGTPVVRHALPPAAPGFVGRDQELAVLAGTAAGGVSAVDGMGGVGKTALAIRAATRLAPTCPDGALFLDLRGHTAGSPPLPVREAVDALLRAVGLAAEPAADLDARLGEWRAAMAGRHAVVVLDNAADSEQVAPLLPGGPSRVLVTSRRRLVTLPCDDVVSLATLGVDDAVAVLAAAAGRERLAREPASARELAGECGGLPLALRLAAARLRHRPAWAVADLVRRLRDERDLSELAVDGVDVAATLGLSLGPVATADRDMLRMLAALPVGEFAAPLAAAISGTSRACARARLEDLLDRHLLLQHNHDRYRLHDLVRTYLRSLPVADADADARHLDRALGHYVHAAVVACRATSPTGRAVVPSVPPGDDELVTPLAEPTAARRWFVEELDGLPRVIAFAAEQGRSTHAWQLAASAAPSLDPAAQGPVLEAAFRVALDAAHRAGDERGQAHLHRLLGMVLCVAGRLETGLRHLDSAADIAADVRARGGLPAELVRELGWVEARALVTAASALNVVGEYGAVTPRLERARALTGHDLALGPLIAQRLAEVEFHVGRHVDAAAAGVEAARLASDVGDRRTAAMALRTAGEALLAVGDPAGARPVLTRAQEHAEASGDRPLQAAVLVSLAAADIASGRLAGAAELLDAAQRRVGGRWPRPSLPDYALRCGDRLRAAGDLGAAAGRYREALTVAERIDAPRDRVRALGALALCDRDAGRDADARARDHAAQTIASRHGLPVLAVDARAG